MQNFPLTVKVRDDFPLLKRKIHGHPLAYLDNAATTQKPNCVIDALVRFYENHNSNVRFTRLPKKQQKFTKRAAKVSLNLLAQTIPEKLFSPAEPPSQSISLLPPGRNQN